MTRFQQKPTPAIYIGIAVTSAAVFIADVFTPLGVVIWIVHVIPVMLSLFVWRRWVPAAVAMASTTLLILGLILSPPGVEAWLGHMNRTFGIITVWVIAAVGYQFIRNRLQVRKEEWLQSGQTRLSETMQGEQRLEELGEGVLRFLAERLDAHAGAIFVDDGNGFRRCAAYGLPQSAGVPERFSLGDGLLGQTAKDGRPFVLQDVPEGYLTIGSGLGRSTPRHLLIAPATADGKPNAVLELGFIHPVYSSDLELLARVAESIGVAIRSSQFRTRLQELLEETQRQAEELQAQAEELRVSNEELAEQGRALTESQTRLELQHAELEQTNTQLEEQTQLLESQKDNLSRAKAALESQASELEKASRYKSDFLANMSHELRTPLNSSLILAKLLAENAPGNLSAEQVKYAQTIYGAGNDLLALINDILDLAKIEAGRMELRPETVRLSRLLENLARTFQPIAAQKALEFHAQAGPGAPETLITDPQRFEQVLRNVISNAIKFTDKGQVNLEVSSRPQGRLAFSVRDTGIGIPAEQHQMIFEPFRQADGTTSRKYGGTGLGLSISKEMVRLLGGEIEVVSQPGVGSTFTVTLPQVYAAALAPVHPTKVLFPPASEHHSRPERAMPVESAESKPVPDAGWRMRHVEDDREKLAKDSRVILVIEDDESFSRVLSDLAHELGFQCLIASTAEEGLALAQQFVPSAMVLDVGLPDNSGLSVLDRLKSSPRTRHIPVHVVSASDYSQRALSLGAVGYMLKPVSREQLVHAFERLESELTHRMRRVLVVEDDPVQLESVRRLLGSREVETIGARSAAECLEMLKTTTVDCMVLDLTLPDATGFALLETISRNDQYAFPPVIVYTGRELTPAQEQQLRKYSSSVIIKGARSPERLLDEVTLFLHQVVSELPVDKQKMLENARSREAALEGRRILVAEDDVRNVFALTSILEPKGAKVEIARNGREALEMLQRSLLDTSQAVDLVLMDIMMPEMDGLTAMREIRKRPEWKKLPIIALTAKAMKSDQEQCLQAGANDYMAKPVDIEKLLSLVRVWMPR